MNASTLPPYATVSREWQLVIEQRTFNTINLNTSERLAAFKQIVAQNTRRKTCIRNINLVVELEPYSIEARAEFETAEEHRRNNEIFVPAIKSLFSILESWPENEPGINLSIEALSPSDATNPQRARQARRDPTKDLRQRRFERSYLQFSEDHLERLPVIHAVTALSMGDVHLRRLILPASCALIASPRLHRLSLSLSYNEKREKALRKQNRNVWDYHPIWGMVMNEIQQRTKSDCLPEHKQRAPEDRVLNAFRMKASPELMNELYMSSGRAAQRMPRLKFMSIRTSEAHAYHSFEYEVDGTTAKETWDAKSLFTPDEPVLQAWRDAAFQHTGVELEVQLTTY
ncbi:hypothetical protein N7486_002195 [Penicillium sp. IBT 16267x]|nr:hypothetical protein N7486_002195 [Penicillium sp. IBT 16267x]